MLGGVHVTVCPDEAQQHADAVVVGEAEPVWRQLIYDFRHGELKPRYRPDRVVWQPGHWRWNGRHYVWVSGRYVEIPRHRHHWDSGHWENRRWCGKS